MPSVYRETLFNKVSPYMPDGTLNQNFDPTIELVDYYDADGSYVNPVVEGAESVEIHQFEDIKPEFTEHSIVDAFAYDSEHEEAISYEEFIQRINALIAPIPCPIILFARSVSAYPAARGAKINPRFHPKIAIWKYRKTP
jgi:hypothetical protein